MSMDDDRDTVPPLARLLAAGLQLASRWEAEDREWRERRLAEEREAGLLTGGVALGFMLALAVVVLLIVWLGSGAG